MNNTGVTILSILVPSIPERKKMLDKLLGEFYRQVHNLNTLHPMLGTAEVLFDDSKKYLSGGLSIGKKREGLVQRASGKYLCFCDVDDLPSPNYIEAIIRLCQQDKDVVTFRNFTKTDFYWTVVDMRLGNIDDQSSPEKIVNRNCWHICPIRSEIAKRHSFPDINYSEDSEWMEKVLPDCFTEAHTDEVLHSYQHSIKFSESDKIIKAGYV